MVTMSMVLISLTLIQVVVGPTTSGGKIVGLSEAEIQGLLRKTGNAEALDEILNLVKSNPEEAKKRMRTLRKKLMSKKMKWLLWQLINVPQKTYEFLLRPALLELHKKLEKESTTYKTFAGPVRNFIEGTGYVILRCLGFTVRSTGELAQLINNIVKEGTAAWNGEVRNEETHNTIDRVAETAQKYGEMFDKDGKEGIQRVVWRSKQHQQANELQKNGASVPNQAVGNSAGLRSK